MTSTTKALSGTKAKADASVRTGQVSPGQRVWQVLRVVILIMGVIYALFPVVIITSAAFDSTNSVSTSKLFNPETLTLDNFKALFNDPLQPFPRWLANSIFTSAIATFLTLLICAMSAYAISRFRFKGRRTTMLGVLIIQVFPNLLAIVAVYVLLQNLGRIFPLREIGDQLAKDPSPISQFLAQLAWLFNVGLDSLGGLILIYIGGAIGFSTWLIKGYFDTVPRDLDESALVDGATQTQTFLQIILPLVRPILAVVAVFSFIGTFSDFLLAKIMLKDTNTYTFAVGLSLYIDGQYGNKFGIFAAASLLGAIPIVFLYMLVQRQITGGLTTGAVKG